MNTKNLKLTLVLSCAAGLLVAAEDAQLVVRAQKVAALIASTGMEFEGIKPGELILQLKALVESLQATADDLSHEQVGIDSQLNRLNQLEQENTKIEKQKQDILLALQHQSPKRGSAASSSSSSSSSSCLQSESLNVSGIVFGEQESVDQLTRSNTKRTDREGGSSAAPTRRVRRRAGPDDTQFRCNICHKNFLHSTSLIQHNDSIRHKTRERELIRSQVEMPTAVVRLSSATVQAAIGAPAAVADDHSVLE